MFLKKKYIAIFVVSEQGTFSVLKVKRFKPTAKGIQFAKGNTHIVDVSKPTYAKGLKLLYFVDIKKGQLGFGKGSGSPVDPAVIDAMLKQGILKQLTSSLFEKAWGGRIMDILLGLALGGLIGFVTGGLL